MKQTKVGRDDSLEGSHCYAIRDPLQAWPRREAEELVRTFRAGLAEGYELEIGHVEELLADCFLAPSDD